MKYLDLGKGQRAVVDDSDYVRLKSWGWYLHSAGYVLAHISKSGKRGGKISLHRAIMNAGKGSIIDHINGNKLDNRRENLRFCSQSQNLQNSRKQQVGSSVYKGVHWHRKNKNWRVRLKVNGKHLHIGSFTNERVAALAYDVNALACFGQFASTNFTPTNYLN